MAEYWKSTPKYWCKFCQVYVRDTAFEKTQHEATGRHQGAIQRQLRNLHKDNEREERQKQRAKDEIARLNGVVGGSSAGASGADPLWKKKPPVPSGGEPPKQATLAERKRQIAQLAEMGIEVPEEFRREMAMAGQWQVLSETPVVQKTHGEDPSAQSVGVRKRKLEGEDEEEEQHEETKRRGWGSTHRTYPGFKGPKGGEDDIAALLGGGIGAKRVKSEELTEEAVVKTEDSPEVKAEPDAEGENAHPDAEVNEEAWTAPIKKEESDSTPAVPSLEEVSEQKVDVPDSKAPDVGTGIVFKKRKNKNMRPR